MSASDPTLRYDAEHIAQFYDTYGEREWERFGRSPADRIGLEIHTRMLAEFVRPGDRVLDAGAGPGRFTIELARLGASVVVGDISPEQIRLNEEKVRDAGFASAVEERHVLDITDLSRFPDASFDVVVCYGGPLSYVWEKADVAARELARVLRPGGHLLVSVMSNLGTHRTWLNFILSQTEEFVVEAVNRVFETGGIPAEFNHGHAMHLFTFSELRDLLESAGCEIAAASASNYLTAQSQAIEPMNDELWEMLVEWELRACRQPGAVDGGTHIIAVGRHS